MSPFEFISVAASLILGLALAQILRAFVRLFRNRRFVKWDWIDLPPKAVPPRVLVQAPPFGWGVVQEAEVG